ncbi:MAG: sigma-70 family RNA polymerase sigma factor [Proteobacteria bacterium]|nr:sigma-70 family RNA polymerase sigma factor [Pseudomonadota bacterium]
MENRLRNLSILVEEYQIHLLDLVNLSWINSSRENNESVLTRIFVSIFRGLRKSKLPLYMFIYSCAIKTILRSKNLSKKITPSIKELDSDVNIEEFNPGDFRDIDIKDAFTAISPLERIILCLNVRHKLSTDEIATILSITPGTILSMLHKSRIKIAKYIIKTNKPDAKKSSLKETKECFFIKNMEPSFRLGILQKDEAAKAARHLSRCSQCKIFYEWHNTIDALVLKVERPVFDNQINMYIFYHLEKFAFLRNILYNLKHNWMVKVPVITALLVILSLVFLSRCSDPNYKKTVILKSRTDTMSQRMQQQTPVKAAIEKKMSYKLITHTIHRKTLSKKILKLINSINARSISIGTEIMNDDGRTNYFNFVVNKKDINMFLDKIKTLDNFEINELEDINTIGKEDIRVEVWVKINNAE